MLSCFEYFKMNFRPQHPKSFGNRGMDLPNPWMSDEEIFNMRRQNPQFHSVMQNMPPAMHSQFLTPNNMISPPNKHFINQNACKMSSSNFTHSSNADIFKSPHSMNDLGISNRIIGDRFSTNSYSHPNLHQKMNDAPLFKDFPSSNMSPQLHKNDGFSDNTPKLFPNMRTSSERFSCMQKDQTQFHRKYDDTPIFQGKDFPFSAKEMQSPNPVSIPATIGNNFSSSKPNYKPTTLFPAYASKESSEVSFQRSQSMTEETSKRVNQSVYNSDFAEKNSAFCDKVPLSTRYPKTVEPFQGKIEPYHERNAPVNDVFSSHNNSPSYLYDKSPYKPMSNSPVPQDSLKALENTVTSSNSKFPFSAGSQDVCFQSSNNISFPKSQSMQMPNHSSASISTDCLMQNVPFSVSSASLNIPTQTDVLTSKESFSSFSTSLQSDVHLSSKETFSSFNISSQPNVHQSSKETFPSFSFDSNINAADISDLLPGLDAFLKDTLNKSEEPSKTEESLNKPTDDISKNELCKSSVPSCAFTDDDWSKHSIPFIGDKISGDNLQTDIKQTFCDQASIKERFDKIESESEKSNEFKLPGIEEPDDNTPVKVSTIKETMLEKEMPKVTSALEEAIDLLVKCDAIVGLDHIIEYKKNISQQGSFPFRCKLCNSAITRPSIIDHIIGSKHRMRYVKSKNESVYEYLVSLKLEKAEKDAKIAEAAFQMELIYGRGSVIVNTEDFQKDSNAENKCEEVNKGIEEPVFTLDKIPIGFEALSPQHEDMDTSAFPLESDLNPVKQDSSPVIQKEPVSIPVSSSEIKKEDSTTLNVEPISTLPGLGSESPPSHFATTDSDTALQLEKFIVDAPKICKTEKEADMLENNSSSFQVKRSLSPHPSCSAKMLKTEISEEESKLCTDVVTDEKSPEIKTEEILVERKEFSMDILDALSKSAISSEEEAGIVLKTINMLIQMFLQYKLSHLSLEKVENLMKSLQVTSPENIDELKSLLNDSKMLSDSEKGQQEEVIAVQNNSKEKNEQKQSNIPEDKPNLPPCESSVSTENSSNHCGSNLMSTTNLSLPVSDIVMNPVVTSVPQHSEPVAVNTAEASKIVSDCSSVNVSASTMNFQTANVTGLKPPPFFSWSQTNDANQTSYTNVQNTQNMMWSNAYQYPQAQYAQLPYYQPQNYGNNFSGTQRYASQFSVLPLNSLSQKMTQPPVPPLPPLPPANPPLPPSVPLPANLPSCMPMFTSQPPPPPPP